MFGLLSFPLTPVVFASTVPASFLAHHSIYGDPVLIQTTNAYTMYHLLVSERLVNDVSPPSRPGTVQKPYGRMAINVDFFFNVDANNAALAADDPQSGITYKA